MARAPKNYAHNIQLSSSNTVIVSAPAASTQSIIRKLSFYNGGSSNRTITVYVVESSGSPATGNIEIVRAISPGTTWNVEEIQGEVIDTGMTLQAVQDSGSDVNVNCSGADIT